jgi:ParB-like chromosome segregation protein Spo0J
MSWNEEDVELVDVSLLHPHEEIKERNRDKLLEMTQKWGGFTKPLLVDSISFTILDGHHRFDVARCLQLSKVPAIMLDYLADERITVAVWPGRQLQSITKQDIVEMALSAELYPPKTSKHTIGSDLPPIFVTLDELA